MQNRISLNAIRVFESAARLRSLKAAGAELHVTAGAVSHQVKALEQSLGILLFERKNNAVVATDAGLRLLESVSPALSSIDNAIIALSSRANDLTLRVSVSLSVRWLIPRLESFRKEHPDTRIKLETTHYTEISLNPGVDAAITYCAKDATITNGRFLIEDRCLPLISPALLAKSNYQEPMDFSRIPAISSTLDNWDWNFWCDRNRLAADELNIVDQFDTDDAAIYAAVAGMGMVLMSPVMARNEIEVGSLVKLPGTEAVKLGSYWFISSARPGPIIGAFEAWLLKEISA
jgi:LysR family glycine cleavage system transcriptional activator